MWKKLRGETEIEKQYRIAAEDWNKQVKKYNAGLLPKYLGKIRFSKNVLSNVFAFLDTKQLMIYRLVCKLWDETFEMTFLWRLKFDVMLDKRYVFNVNWLETEDVKFIPYYNLIRSHYVRVIGYKGFLK
jgi:hypothetical protein